MRIWLMVMGVGLLLLQGCADVRHWKDRAVWGIDCRQEVVAQNQGRCVPVQKGS